MIMMTTMTMMMAHDDHRRRRRGCRAETGADGGTRTLTGSPPQDFKSLAAISILEVRQRSFQSKTISLTRRGKSIVRLPAFDLTGPMMPVLSARCLTVTWSSKILDQGSLQHSEGRMLEKVAR